MIDGARRVDDNLQSCLAVRWCADCESHVEQLVDEAVAGEWLPSPKKRGPASDTAVRHAAKNASSLWNVVVIRAYSLP
jgi:hypothetical protein